MKYDFESIMDRKGHDATAVEGIGRIVWGYEPASPGPGFDSIPMWVADMNFPTCPTITEAIIERAKHPAFGYFMPRDEYYASIIRWHEIRNGVRDLTKECIAYDNGVLGGVISALGALCSRGDNVLLNSPTYVGFTSCMTNNGYHMVLSEMKKDPDGIWRMDFEDMERKIVEKHIHTAVFCSPHNPSGRVWKKWELEKFAGLCEKHRLYVISDEIWSDIIMEGHRHIPLQSVSDYMHEHTVALYAPSKTFNLAGLVGSYRIIYNPWLRDRVAKESSLSHYNDMNVLSMHALIGAMKPEGYEWCDELCMTINKNINYAVDQIQTYFRGVEVSRPEGTYMLFIDCGQWCREHGTTIDGLLKAAWAVGVDYQDGRPFHGEHHIRMNLALPFSRVQEAFERLKKYVFV